MKNNSEDIEDYTKQARPWYRTWKIIPAIWVGLSILFAVSSLSSQPPASNTNEQQPAPKPETVADLNASITYNYTALTIKNNESAPWGKCKYILNSKYDYSGSNVTSLAGQSIVLNFSNFVDGNKRFNVYNEKPANMLIQCYRNGTQQADGYYSFEELDS